MVTSAHQRSALTVVAYPDFRPKHKATGVLLLPLDGMLVDRQHFVRFPYEERGSAIIKRLAQEHKTTRTQTSRSGALTIRRPRFP